MTNAPKFPHVEVDLVGQDGNAFMILGRVSQAMRRAGVDDADVKAYSAGSSKADRCPPSQERKTEMDNCETLDIVFDGAPGHPAPQFVEVEDQSGHSVGVGEWVDRGDGTWAIRLDVCTSSIKGRS